MFSYMKIYLNIFFYSTKYCFRLTPALAATVFFTSYLLRYIGNGPRWNSITSMEDACKKYWWTTLLYVQNYANENNNLVSIFFYVDISSSIFTFLSCSVSVSSTNLVSEYWHAIVRTISIDTTTIMEVSKDRGNFYDSRNFDLYNCTILYWLYKWNSGSYNKYSVS